MMIDEYERVSKRNLELVKRFEKGAKEKGLCIRREKSAPKGYWYCDGATNLAFYWFLSGLSYGELISR
jgi:hypothetical protein